jgi:hypothetical protein
VEIREAILKAADHIEKHPREFDGDSVTVPDLNKCGTPGCAIGWILSFSGEEEGDYAWHRVCKKHLGVTDLDFYLRMNEIEASGWWRKNNVLCAETMRLYADKYHHEIKTPNWEALAKPDSHTFKVTCG